MSSNQRKNTAQRNRNSNYNNNNNQHNANSSNAGKSAGGQKRPRYQPKYSQNQKMSPQHAAAAQRGNNWERQYSPKQSSPKHGRYNQGHRGPVRQQRGGHNNYYQPQQAQKEMNDDEQPQRFKLKPTKKYDQSIGYNNNEYHRNNKYDRSPQNQAIQHQLKMNDDEVHEIPPGLPSNDYPPNRYRPNDTNNSERNRNWRNRYNPPSKAERENVHDQSPINKNPESPLKEKKMTESPLIIGTPGSDHSASHSQLIEHDAAGELFGAIYGQNEIKPSIAYPVIQLVLNKEYEHDSKKNDEIDSKQRKYPISYLLNIGKDILESPRNPNDDIPDSVKYINTIKIAEKKYNRFGTMHQLTPSQLPQTANNEPLKTENNKEENWRQRNKEEKTEKAEEKINGAICAEDIEQQLMEQQRAEKKEEHDIQQIDVDGNGEIEEEFKAMQIHKTPELKPDSMEMVEEENDVNPEWADKQIDDEEIIETDFEFGVIDKERDRQHFKEHGALPQDVVTISREEYERRNTMKKHPRKPPMPHHTNQKEQYYTELTPRAHPLRSQSTPKGSIVGDRNNNSDSLPIDKLPSRIKGIVIRLDEDIAKISTYIQQVALEKDQLNRYQRHLNKLIARRGQYANWWKAQQLKANSNTSQIKTEKKEQQTVGLRHTNSLQQLEHYKDYYNKQLDKMKQSASNDPKFNTYVDYYRQKLKAVEKRQRELEIKLNHNNNKKKQTLMDVMNDTSTTTTTTTTKPMQLQQQQPLTQDNDDPFASLMNLDELGYTQAAPAKPPQPAAPQPPQPQQAQYQPSAEEAMYAYMYGAAPPQQQPQHIQPQQPPQHHTMHHHHRVHSHSHSQPKQRNAAHQKQKLKAYIRQHALKYVKPPPDPTDETYPAWYQGLRKVENIIYAKYMNKQRKRMEQLQQNTNKNKSPPPQRQQYNVPPPQRQPQQQQYNVPPSYGHPQHTQHSSPYNRSPPMPPPSHQQPRHLNISPPQQQQAMHHITNSPPIHQQQPYQYQTNPNISPNNQSPPMSPPQHHQYPTHQSPPHHPSGHPLDKRQHPPMPNMPNMQTSPYHHHQYQSPPNPQPQNMQNMQPQTTTHGYTTYNTSSPPNPSHPYPPHQYIQPQTSRSPPNPHQYTMHD